MPASQRTVLIVEDNAMDLSLIAQMLRAPRSGVWTQTAATLAEAEAVLATRTFDLVISDLSLPDSHGLHTFKRLDAAAGGRPLIVISGTDDEELALQAVREGAQDYLVKGQFDGHSLRRAINYAIERHRLEVAREQGEKHQRQLIERITDHTFTAKLRDGEVLETIHSPQCLVLTGFTPEHYRHDSRLWLRMIHRDDQPVLAGQLASVMRGEMPLSVEIRLFHRSGELRWVRSTVMPRKDDEGRLVAYDCLIRDITARKTAEEKLVRSEAFYHSLVESLPQHIIRKDLNERFTFANQRFCQLLGRKLEEVIGRTDFDFFASDLATKYQSDDRHVIKTSRVFETVEVNQAPGGEKRFVNVIKSPIHDDKGRVIGIQGIFWDITERMKAEADLRRAHEELRQSHADLKAAQLQLIQAAKMESIGTLAAGVAHEVKNPLATLTMGLSFLENSVDKANETQAMVLAEMREAVVRADKITRGLLDFAASRQLDVRGEDLNGLLERTLVLLRHELNKQHIELRTEFAEGLPTVAVEKNQVQQVFVNILMNAIHAMEGGGTLTVRTYQRRPGQTLHDEGSRTSQQIFLGDTLVVTEIEDSGPGIPSENLAKIFDPFFTTKPTGVGTGLGLPVSKKIIELHGGTINITNRPGGGVRVSILLRAEKPYEKESPAGR